MSDISNKFADSLASEVSKKYENLPACTYLNTMQDLETGICSSRLLSRENLTEKIKELVKNDSSLQQNATLTPESAPLLSSIQQTGSDLPTYLNIFYALSIVCAGLAACISLWLILKHRLFGIITLGASGVLAGFLLFIAAVLGTQQIGTISDSQHILQIARAGSSAIEIVLQKQALLVTGSGLALVFFGSIVKIYLIRRKKSQPSLRLPDNDDNHANSKAE